GAMGFFSEPRVRRLLFALPVCWIVVILACYYLAVPGSVMQTESLASAISITCVLLMTLTCLVQHGPKTVLNAIFFAVSGFVVLSWFAYFFVPVIGVFEEPIADGQFKARMSGLAHPNTLGQFSGVLIVLACILHVNYKQMSWIRAGLVLLAVAALIGSLSRTSLLATVFAVAVVYREHVLKPKYFYALIGVGLLGLVGLLVMSINSDLGSVLESKLALLSKSGDTEELTSATGRVDIWAYAIHLLSQRPITGYGAATSKYHLVDYSLYTHNMILNIAFSAGAIAGVAAVLMCLGRAGQLCIRNHRLTDGLIAFILLNGLFENVIFSILAGMPTIVWIVAMSIPSFEAIENSPPTEILSLRSPDDNGASPRRPR
ncbi:MAG: exopolysaccharide production protein ExoQ, partial [Mariniblastus sp.]